MAKSKKRGPAQKSKSSYAQELQMKKQLGASARPSMSYSIRLGLLSLRAMRLNTGA